MARVVVYSELGAAALADPSTALPSCADQATLERELEALAGAGLVFYVRWEWDDAEGGREVLVEALHGGDAEPLDTDEEYEPGRGTFGLLAPSGRLTLYGWRDGAPVAMGDIETAAGALQVTAAPRREFDSARHDEEMARLLGDDWAHMKRVDKVGGVGCLVSLAPLVALAFALFTRRWDWLPLLFGATLLCMVPHWLLARGKRYKRAAARAKEHEKAKPQCLIRVAPTEHADLAGGHVWI